MVQINNLDGYIKNIVGKVEIGNDILHIKANNENFFQAIIASLDIN